MSDHAVHFSTGKDDWETPDDLFNRYNATYRFVLDAAANSQNAKVSRFYGPGGECEDALVVPWPLHEGNIWLNPPYSRGLQARFVNKAWEEVKRGREMDLVGSVVCLLPARTDTRLFHDTILAHGHVEFLRGRVKFKGAQQGAPFPSMIVRF